jgi:hypothetical protein
MINGSPEQTLLFNPLSLLLRVGKGIVFDREKFVGHEKIRAKKI